MYRRRAEPRDDDRARSEHADGGRDGGALTLGARRNARYLGYAMNVSGSDWKEIRVRDVESLKDLKDTCDG